MLSLKMFFCVLFSHRWEGCKCKVCSEIRDFGHVFEGCKCVVCGKIRSTGHQYTETGCRICGGSRHQGLILLNTRSVLILDMFSLTTALFFTFAQNVGLLKTMYSLQKRPIPVPGTRIIQAWKFMRLRQAASTVTSENQVTAPITLITLMSEIFY